MSMRNPWTPLMAPLTHRPGDALPAAELSVHERAPRESNRKAAWRASFAAQAPKAKVKAPRGKRCRPVLECFDEGGCGRAECARCK